MSNAPDTSGTSFVVYVPPDTSGGSTDTSIQSCLRLGVSHPDETTTYNNVVSASDSFLSLSSKYQPAHGIALLTPGNINLISAGGTTITSGSISTSMLGPTYSVTQDPTTKMIVAASLNDNKEGAWSTSSFTQAITTAVSDSPLAATFGAGINYAFSGGLSFQNGLGLSFASAIGAAVSAPLSLNVNIGNNSISSSWPFGDGFQYQEEASTTANKISLTVDSSKKNPKLAILTGKNKAFVVLLKAAGMAIDAAILVYAASAAGTAASGKPSAVKGWLYSAEPIAILCTTINGLLGALGAILGIIQLVMSETPGPGSTSLVVGDGAIQADAGGGTGAMTNKLTLDMLDGLSADMCHGEIALGVTIAGATSSATIKFDEISLTTAQNTLSLKKDGLTVSTSGAELTVKDSEISLKVGTNELKISSSGVTINGTQVALNAPQTKLTSASTGVPPVPSPPKPKKPLPPPPKAAP